MYVNIIHVTDRSLAELVDFFENVTFDDLFQDLKIILPPFSISRGVSLAHEELSGTLKAKIMMTMMLGSLGTSSRPREPKIIHPQQRFLIRKATSTTVTKC